MQEIMHGIAVCRPQICPYCLYDKADCTIIISGAVVVCVKRFKKKCGAENRK